MKVILGADSYGFSLKQAVKAALLENGYDVFDATEQPAFFADAAKQVAAGVQRGEYQRGIAFCGTGMGVSIIANKHKGVYAALCESVYQARRAKIVNNTNVLCMGGMIIGDVMGVEMALSWLTAEHLMDMDAQMAAQTVVEFEALVAIEEDEYQKY